MAEISPKHSPLDKALQEIVQKIDAAQKTCKNNNTGKKEQNTGKAAAQDLYEKWCIEKTFKEKWLIVQ